MREAHRFEKASEVSHVSHPTFELDLLLQVERGIGIENVLRVGCSNDERKQASPERVRERGVRILRRHERVERPDHGAAGQEIDPASPQLPRARSVSTNRTVFFRSIRS